MNNMREGEPCSHQGCLNHISHPCEGCGRIGGRYILYFAIESYKYGLSITYDGDKHKIMFGGTCSHCGEYFEDGDISLYCRKCTKTGERLRNERLYI